MTDIELVPTTPEERKKLKERGITLPSVSDETWRSIGGVADNAGKSLSVMEKRKIPLILKKYGIRVGAPVSVKGPKFLLHDTSASITAAKIKQHKAEGKGPLGAGVSAWVPKKGASTIARPAFFESKRPSTSEWEKAADIIEQSDREKVSRAIWKITKPDEIELALDRALSGTGLSKKQIKKIKSGAKKFMKGVTKKLPDGAKSAAAWAVGEICAKAEREGAAKVATTGKEKDLAAECKKLAGYFSTRTARVGSTVSVEIVQVGVKKGATNFNTCDPKNPDIAPIPSPPYTDSQYRSLVVLYLRAALMAGRFPEITTHFVVDAFKKGHCDPRCFDLKKLYDGIALTLGHGVGSTYGIKPSFGTTWGTHTVWWHDKICGGSPPK